MSTRKEQREATAKILDVLQPTPLGPYMRGEIEPPEMLLPDWLQKGVLHWMQGEPEHGKSWVALRLAVDLLKADRTARVLLMDGEMGPRAIGERLHTLGLDADTAEERVKHVAIAELPQTLFGDFVVWASWAQFSLVIWDPVIHWLASAGLKEDSNDDFTRWMSGVVRPLLARGQTHLGVDHVTKNGDDRSYARGASAKKGAADVIYVVERKKEERFGREQVGTITVKSEKNKHDAAIPRERSISLGGEPQTGRFVWRPAQADPTVTTDRRRETARNVVDKAVAILEKLESDEERSERALAQEIGGKLATTTAALREAATTYGGRLSQRVEEQGKRTFVYYRLRGEDDVRQP